MRQVYRVAIVLALSAVLSVVVMLIRRGTEPQPLVTRSDEAAQALLPQTYDLILALEAGVQKGDRKAVTLTQLGQAYLQGARESGDGVFVDKAERVFNQALEDDPGAYEAMNGLGQVYLTRHLFRDALAWGQHSLAINPDKVATYGILVDAYLELGRYEEAVASAQQMVDLRPDMGSYSRISYVRELYGDLAGATEAMERAVSAGSGSRENTAWCRVFLGHLYYLQGNLEAAANAYQLALYQLPGYGHALAGMGRVMLARQQPADAVVYYEAAVATFPIPEYLIALGEAYEAAGQAEAATALFDRAVAVLEEERASGMDVDEELALLLLQRGHDVERAHDLAAGAYERRPTVKNANILAWASYKTGHPERALSLALASHRLGTRDPGFYYRTGLIAAAAGWTEQAEGYLAQAFAINPHWK